MPETRLSRLRLLQLLSPTLPTGAFTYSQGMEWAVECGWIRDEDDTRQWLCSLMQLGLYHLELPVLTRLYQAVAKDDTDAFQHWSHRLYACRETSELREEEVQRARALLTVLQNLPGADERLHHEDWQAALAKTQLAPLALAACHWEIPLTELLPAYVWSWLDNALQAAIKLVPLGQTQGQKLLYELAGEADRSIDTALDVADDAVGSSTPAQAIASSLHERQYSRLFRS